MSNDDGTPEVEVRRQQVDARHPGLERGFEGHGRVATRMEKTTRLECAKRADGHGRLPRELRKTGQSLKARSYRHRVIAGVGGAARGSQICRRVIGSSSKVWP